MVGRRSYADGCAAAHALDLIGERWALLVVRELLLGPKRFTDLRAGLQGISPNVLTQRLGELEQARVVRRRKLSPPAAAWVYELTEWGQELEDVVMSLGRWGARSPALLQGHPLSIDAVILSLRTMFDPDAAAGFDARIELRVGDERFHAHVANARLELERGAHNKPDAVVHAEPDTLVSIVYGGRKISEALRSGELRIDGDRSVVKRFVTLFPLPEPASADSR